MLQKIKENKLVIILIILFTISIITNIIVWANIPTQEEVRLANIEQAKKNRSENMQLIMRYEKILDIYYKRLELETKCINANSNTGTVVDCTLYFKK